MLHRGEINVAGICGGGAQVRVNFEWRKSTKYGIILMSEYG